MKIILINFCFCRLTETGLTEGLSKVTNRTQPASTIIESANEDERENLISKRESSHEYD